MNRTDELRRIIHEVNAKMNSTVLSYEERDPRGFKWGMPNYPGNCSGKVPLGFIEKLGILEKKGRVCELFAGSGTLSDVCRDYGIPYCGIDLNPNPVRPDIHSMNILNMNEDLPSEFYQADMCFSHPPYPGIKHIKYAGHAWKDEVGLKNMDIQNMPFEKGMKMVNFSTLRAYSALPKGSFLVILVGEIRANGKYYSMYQNLALPGEVFQSYVKIQHNTASGRNAYSNNYSRRSQRALTDHEMIVVCKKPSGYEFAYVIPFSYKNDIRDMANATWKDVVMSYARENKRFSNNQIYENLKNHKKGKNNNNLSAKLRQTCAKLAEAGLLVHTSSGYWACAA